MAEITNVVIRKNSNNEPATCLVTGATGYIGGRLIRELLNIGYKVKVFARFPDRLRDMPWFEKVEIISGDALKSEDVEKAMQNVDVAYYLLHALNKGNEFVEIETKMAQIFADSAKKNRVQRIIYLGGLIPSQKLSQHLESRKITGEILRNSGISTIELRAGVVIGEGLTVESLRRFKDDATEVKEGFECGIGLGSFKDLQIGDVIQTYEMREKKRA